MSKAVEIIRKCVVKQGRSMVRVKYKDTQELTTAAVCPGCWNDSNRRFVLLKQMDRMGVVPVHKNDLIDGFYRNKNHFPDCPHKKRIDKSWDDFKKSLKVSESYR